MIGAGGGRGARSEAGDQPQNTQLDDRTTRAALTQYMTLSEAGRLLLPRRSFAFAFAAT